MSIIENRKPWIDENLAGNITAAGICAHESAMRNGESIIIPDFVNKHHTFTLIVYYYPNFFIFIHL